MLLIVILASESLVYANDFTDTKMSPEIELMYENMSNISSTIKIFDGSAICTGKVRMTKYYIEKMEMTLQRRTKSGAYTEYATWNASESGVGLKTLKKVKGVKKGYYYRVKVVVRIYSGNTNVENGAKYSSEIYY